MFQFVSIIFGRKEAANISQKLESDSRLMGLIGLLCTVIICFMAANTAESPQMALYRVLWVSSISGGLILLYRSGIYAAEMSSSRSFLTIVAVLAHLSLIMLVNRMAPMLPEKFHGGVIMLLMPWMFAPALTAVLIGRRMGMFTTLSVSLLGMALFPASQTLTTFGSYLVMSIFSGAVAATICGRVHKREHILYAGFAVGIIVFASALILGLLFNSLHTFTHGFNFKWLCIELLLAVGSSFLFAVFIGGIMPLLERFFNLCTPITWLELGDMNHKLIKELQLRAPGTFHHCIVVSRLAEAAAEAIGANATHSAVCALFHDIGKLKQPEYYAENITAGAINPHDSLTPEASARIITDHVNYGVEIAEENKLNSRIIDTIREHHGTSSAYYFYHKAMEKYKESLARFEEGQLDTQPKPVNIKNFTYPGPIPQTPESGIVSMADAVESATRSLTQPTEQDIMQMIESIFKVRILDGHLTNSKLTMRDLNTIKQSFLSTIKSMHNNRIAYPKKEDEEEEETPNLTVPAPTVTANTAPSVPLSSRSTQSA